MKRRGLLVALLPLIAARAPGGRSRIGSAAATAGGSRRATTPSPNNPQGN